MQCVTLAHYWSVPAEAATFLFSIDVGDWITWLWHAVLFSSLCVCCTRGACPRFRRLGNSYVTWRHDARKLRGTSSSDDELSSLKATFSLLSFPAMVGILLMVCAEILGDSPGFSFRPPSSWYLPWGLGFSWLLWCVVGVFSLGAFYIGLVIVMLSIFPQKLIGTRPASLPTFMSLLVRTKAPQFMISYSWGGEREQSLLMLAHGLAEVLPDCWIDVRRLVPGQRLLDEVRLPAAQARVLVVLMNPAYVKSTNCGHELLAALKERDPAVYRTVVLIEPPNLVVGYAPRWQRIHELLEKAGFDVVRSIESSPDGSSIGLLEWLDNRACRHDTDHKAPEDARKTMAWFKRYEDGVAEATSSAQDLRLPWNFFIAGKTKVKLSTQAPPLRTASSAAASAREMTTISFFSRPREYLAALFFHRRPASAITTGLGGMWLAANAANKPRPHVDVSPTVISTILIGTFVPVAILAVIYFFRWSIPENMAAGIQVFWFVLNGEIGGVAIICVITFAPILLFAVRWGDVLAAPGSMLHSPELFVPLLVRELHQLVPDSDSHDSSRLSLHLKVCFVTPRGSNIAETDAPRPSNCALIANNMSAFLIAAGFDSHVREFDKAGLVADADSNTVYVLMIERKRDARAWVESQRARTGLSSDQTVLVTSDRFFSEHRGKLSEWLVIEFAESGAHYALTPSGTTSDLGLASQILNAISMKLVNMLANRGHRREVTTSSTVAASAADAASSGSAESAPISPGGGAEVHRRTFARAASAAASATPA
jgi:hypothetical protein